jgi:hypothetical protein
MLKIIIIIIEYTLKNFTTHITNIIVDDENNNNNFKILKKNSFFENKQLFVFSMWKLTLGYGSPS